MQASKIIIGCMSWGVWGKKLTTKEQAALIHFCVENGNTTFDHADLYGDYTTEAEFGKAFLESGINRDAVQLISKCGIQNPGQTRKHLVKHYNYSREHIIWSAENALQNLKTDALDAFLLHRPSPLMQPDEIAEAVTHLKNSGKIKTFGVSNFTPSQMDLIASRVSLSFNQLEFSLTSPSAMFNGTLDYLLEKEIQPMSWSPLGSIFKVATEQTHRVKQVLKKLSLKYDLSEDGVLLAFVLRHPAQVSPVIGTTNKVRILNANKGLKTTLELEDWFELLTASQGHEVP